MAESLPPPKSPPPLDTPNTDDGTWEDAIGAFSTPKIAAAVIAERDTTANWRNDLIFKDKLINGPCFLLCLDMFEVQYFLTFGFASTRWKVFHF